MEVKRRIAKLIAMYLQGQLTVDQQTELNNWLNKSPENLELFQIVTDSVVTRLGRDAETQLRSETWEKIVNMAPELAAASRSRNKWRKWSVAAYLSLLGMTSWYINNCLESEVVPEIVSHKIPYQNHQEKAILRLSDNKEILLDVTAQGVLAKQGGVVIRKIENGRLIYETDSNSNSKASRSGELYNSITTSKGSQYQVELPDGTMVWLNSVSSLRFPVHFSGDMREVFITGEAYFEVSQQHLAYHSKNKRKGSHKKPFIVHATGSQIEVLGTHFNIKAYADEPAVKTTLLEGKIKVKSPASSSKNITLRPGQQASFSKDGDITISYPDLNDVISWKKGIVTLENIPLQEVTRQIARWHDVEVVYKGPVTKDKFYVDLHREHRLLDIVKVISLTERFTYRIEGKRVIIIP